MAQSKNLMVISGLCGSLKTYKAIKIVAGLEPLPLSFNNSTSFIIAFNGNNQIYEFKNRLDQVLLDNNITASIQIINSETTNRQSINTLREIPNKCNRFNPARTIILCNTQSITAIEDQSIFDSFTVIFDDPHAMTKVITVYFDKDTKEDDHFIYSDSGSISLTQHAKSNLRFEGKAKSANYNNLMELINSNNWLVNKTSKTGNSSTFIIEPTHSSFPKNMILISAHADDNIEINNYVKENPDINVEKAITLETLNNNHNSNLINLIYVTEDKLNTLYTRKTYPELYHKGFRDAITNFIPTDEECLLLANKSYFDKKQLGRDFIKMAYNNEGMNEYKDHNNLVIQLSINYDPATISYYADNGVSPEKLHTTRTIFKYYQSIMRLILRNSATITKPVNVLLFNSSDAIELKEKFFPNANIIKGSDVVFPDYKFNRSEVDRSEYNKQGSMKKKVASGKHTFTPIEVMQIQMLGIRDLMKLPVWDNYIVIKRKINGKK